LFCVFFFFFFFQAEDGIRDGTVTGVQTCALPIFPRAGAASREGIPARGSLGQESLPGSPHRPEEAANQLPDGLVRDVAGHTLVRSEERRVGKEGRSGGATGQGVTEETSEMGKEAQ